MTVLFVPLPINVILAVVLLAVAYTSTTLKIQRKIADPRKMRETQAKMQRLNKEMSEMMKMKQDVRAKQAEMMPLLKESMHNQLKSMLVVLPMFFAVYYGALPFLMHPYVGDQVMFIVPLSYSSLFIATAFVFGFSLGMVLMLRDRIKGKKDALLSQLPQHSA